MSNNTNNNQYDNTYYDDSDDSSIYFLYFLFFLGAILYGIPHIHKAYKAMCKKNEDEESEDEDENNYVPDEEIQMDLTDRELKPDYDSDDENEENKYI